MVRVLLISFVLGGFASLLTGSAAVGAVVIVVAALAGGYNLSRGRIVATCPYCGRTVKLGAAACGHCGRSVGLRR